MSHRVRDCHVIDLFDANGGLVNRLLCEELDTVKEAAVERLQRSADLFISEQPWASKYMPVTWKYQGIEQWP